MALLALLAACGSEGGAAGSGETPASTTERGVLPPTPTTVPLFADTGLADPLQTVPELHLTGIEGWINSDELSLEQLAEDGRVVLLDFWTYTCVNCVRTFPFLKAMHERYAPHGLTVIGVHSPEFDFEKERANVELAVTQAGLDYPIALDSEKVSWAAFGNRFWPTTYLIGSDGEAVYRHFGEGGYDDTELRIRTALESAGADLSGIERGGDFEPPVVENAHTQTREIYAGYRRGYDSAGLFAAQDAYYLAPDTVVDYVDTELRRHEQFELSGRWLNAAESLVYDGPGGGDGSDGYIVFPFLAASVNGVIRTAGMGGTVVVELDGAPLERSAAGADVTYDDSGRSVIVLDQPRMYRIVETDEFKLSELKLTFTEPGTQLHNFTFGVFSEGP